ncbi:MAG TPA: class I SAM-dependent methyltransferase [Gemmatimonadaceae bacterium]
MSDDLAGYYARRAREYERIYEKPERRTDLAALRRVLPTFFTGRDVLEVACGTGWWTQTLFLSARSIVAVDINAEVLEIARAKPHPESRVRFVLGDAFALDEIEGRFDGAFSGFWWSHVELRRLRDFLGALHARLAPGARVVHVDNRYVEGSSTPIARRDEAGNTYQIRTLDGGDTFEVLKNFPEADEVRAALDGIADDVHVVELDYYWFVTYVTREGRRKRARSAPRR